jgi:hypothetical protein
MEKSIMKVLGNCLYVHLETYFIEVNDDIQKIFCGL